MLLINIIIKITTYFLFIFSKRSCESDKSLYESLRLNNTNYNTTYLKKEVSQVFTEIRDQVDKAIPDTIDIEFVVNN